jgi:hypothetical protein
MAQSKQQPELLTPLYHRTPVVPSLLQVTCSCIGGTHRNIPQRGAFDALVRALLSECTSLAAMEEEIGDLIDAVPGQIRPFLDCRFSIPRKGNMCVLELAVQKKAIYVISRLLTLGADPLVAFYKMFEEADLGVINAVISHPMAAQRLRQPISEDTPSLLFLLFSSPPRRLIDSGRGRGETMLQWQTDTRPWQAILDLLMQETGADPKLTDRHGLTASQAIRRRQCYSGAPKPVCFDPVIYELDIYEGLSPEEITRRNEKEETLASAMRINRSQVNDNS